MRLNNRIAVVTGASQGIVRHAMLHKMTNGEWNLAEVRQLAPRAILDGVLAQEMVPARMELTCGLQRDSLFGPMVAIGLGGVLVKQLAETVLPRPPSHLAMARTALGQLLHERLILGRRGLSEQEQDQVGAIMVGIGKLAPELDEVQEIDVNPIRVADGLAFTADALVGLAGRAFITEHP